MYTKQKYLFVPLAILENNYYSTNAVIYEHQAVHSMNISVDKYRILSFVHITPYKIIASYYSILLSSKMIKQKEILGAFIQFTLAPKKIKQKEILRGNFTSVKFNIINISLYLGKVVFLRLNTDQQPTLVERFPSAYIRIMTSPSTASLQRFLLITSLDHSNLHPVFPAPNITTGISAIQNSTLPYYLNPIFSCTSTHTLFQLSCCTMYTCILHTFIQYTLLGLF